jgi:hypothetical protein
MIDLLSTALALPDIKDAPTTGIHRITTNRDRAVDELFCYATPEPTQDACLAVGWSTGGMEGGSYLNTEVQTYTTDIGPCHLLLLDALLAVVAPGISQEHRGALHDAAEEGTHIEYEYYGNSIDYAFRLLPLSIVAERLEGWGYA